ncbi:MAG: TonB-dependent receptor [Bacteroidetes bacterium]|nr:MAG: TonB-dependent receptor [Bacteroidota bacterium]
MKKVLLLLSLSLIAVFPLLAQTISGTVLSGEDNSPLPGVTIQVKGTSSGTLTDFDGKYQLKAGSDAVLVFSFVGFITQEVPVGSQSTIDLTLKPDFKQLQEVVVVGYGTQIRSEMTANIATVSGKDLQNIPVPTMEGAMQGRSAGVFIESSSGKVGQGMKVRVRGAASLSASNQPLYVIDGVIMNTADLSSNSGATNPMADINPNDIESVEILKDAASASIYGARGSNGVVIITTKKGKAGDTKFNVGYQVGISNPTRKRTFLNASQYMELYKEAMLNDGYTQADFEGEMDFLSLGTDWKNKAVDTDWQSLVFPKNQGFQQLDFSMSGGNEKTRFYVSTNYTDQKGILIKNAFQRISGRVNLDHTINDKWKIGTSVMYSKSFNNRAASDNSFANPLQIVALPPISPARKADGTSYDTPDGLIYYNPLVEVENAHFFTNVNRVINNSYLTFNPIKELMIRGEFGMDVLSQNEDRFAASNTESGRGARGTATGQNRNTVATSYISKLFANYNKTFAEFHNVDITVGTEYQFGKTEYTDVQGQAMPDAIQKLVAAGQITSGTSFLTQYAFLSYFGRVNYKFNGKYLLGVTVRTDGSSRFGADNRFGTFPSASAGWVISEEDFLRGNKTFSFLKLRASYGLTGNSEIGNFASSGLFSSAAYGLLGGLYKSQLANPALTWEKATQIDLGIDFGFLDNRISGEIDYFSKESTGLLLGVPVPGTSGFRSTTQNLGGLKNQGVEVVINTNNLVGEFKWNTSFNITFIKNEVTSLGGQTTIDPGGARTMNVARVGYPIGTFWGAPYAGVNPANGNAQWFNADGTKTETFSANLYTNLGSPNPDFYGGLTNNFSYKGFDLSILLQGVSGNKVHAVGDQFMFTQFGNGADNQVAEAMNRWQKAGDITDVPRATYDGVGGGFNTRSSRYLYDGSYLRVKTVTLGYNVPLDFAKKYKLNSMRVYLTAQNLFTFTAYKGWDPEVSADYLTSGGTTAANLTQGVDFYSVPQAQTFTGGINIGF